MFGLCSSRTDSTYSPSAFDDEYHSRGAWVDGQRVLFDSDIPDGAAVVADIAGGGAWIVACGRGAWVSGARVLSDSDLPDGAPLSLGVSGASR